MNDVTLVNNQIAEVDFKSKAVEYLNNMGTKLPPAQSAQFLELCQAYKLNPFKREIYAVGYGNKFNIIVGYEVYLKRASRTGLLNGWHCETNDNGTKAKVTIYRKDWQYPFEHEVLLDEVKQNSPIWQKMQTFMMKKVCIEQGFRLCFPDEMGGMPYGEEEVSYDRVVEPEERNVTPEPEIESDADKLKKLLNSYPNKISDEVKNMCQQALDYNNADDISDKLSRLTVYLQRQGVRL